MKRTRRFPRNLVYFGSLCTVSKNVITQNVCLIIHQYPKNTKEQLKPSQCGERFFFEKSQQQCRRRRTFESLCMMMTMKPKKTKQEKKFANFFAQLLYFFFAQTQQSGAQFANHVNVNCQSMNQRKKCVWVWRASRAAFLWLRVVHRVIGMLVLNQKNALWADDFRVATDAQSAFPMVRRGDKNDCLCPESFLSCAQSNFHIHNWMLLPREAPPRINRCSVWERARTVAYFPCGGLCFRYTQKCEI